MAKPSTKRQRTREFWQRHLLQWQESDLSAKAYAGEQGLAIAPFNRWRHRLKPQALPTKASFVPVNVTPSLTLSHCPLVLTGSNGLQLTLKLSSEQLPLFLPFVRGLLCGH